MPAVPNLWVATPRGVAIHFHWGRHWSSDTKKFRAQLHAQNVQSYLCQKFALSNTCTLSRIQDLTKSKQAQLSHYIILVENNSVKILRPDPKHRGVKSVRLPTRNLTSHPNPERQGVKSILTEFSRFCVI